MAKKKERRWTDRKISIRKKVVAIFFTVPFAILLGAAGIFAFRETVLTPQLLSTLSIASYILAFVGMGLSAGFNRSPLFFVLLLLTLSQVAFSMPVTGPLAAADYYDVVYYFSCLLLPLNILVFSLLKDRGTFTVQGKRRLGLILVQLLVVAVVILSRDADMLAYIHQDLASSPLSLNTPLTAKALAVSSVAILALLLRQSTRVIPVDNAFFHALLALTAAFHFKFPALPLFYTATAAMLTTAAIQDSYAIAYLDELTGLPSRRALQEDLGKLGDKYTVAMVDIDFFKKINDKYGHDVGDDVLRFLAAALGREVVDGGKSFRYGGEEFILLFPDKDCEEVRPFLEELCRTIAKRPFILRGRSADDRKLSVTVSIGCAERLPVHQKPDEVIKAADIALYQAKEGGRNRVVG
ncbi:MAG: GGDEF domain-containing protein [Negativicutes bacterium]|nr:GGDEF domain-containing protein [Negativicutes bacterium]